MAAPLVADRRPLRAIVYLAAFIPVPGESMADQFRSSPEPVLLFQGGRENDAEGRSRWTDAETTARVMYPDLSAADARAAFARLRPQAPRPQVEPYPAPLPSVRAASFICREDRVVNPTWSRRVTRERLDVEPVELPIGHFPMITDPQLLADALAAEAVRPSGVVARDSADVWPPTGNNSG